MNHARSVTRMGSPKHDMAGIVSPRLRITLALGLAAPWALAAQGGATDPKDSTAKTLKAVRVSETRSVGSVGGASAMVVSTETLRSSPAPVLDQLLREAPSITVRQNSRGEMELSVRGSDSRQVAVMMDGVPLTLGWDHRSDPSLIPITGSEEVVIVRGLGSILGGPNALGGTISVSQSSAPAVSGVTRSWGAAGVDGTAAFVASLGMSRTLDVGRGVLTVRGGFAHRDRDGVALPDGATDPTAHQGLRTNSDLRERDAFASVRWRSTAGRSLGLTVTGFDAQRGVPPEEHLAQPRLWRYPYSTRTVVALSASTGAFATPFGFATVDLAAGHNAGRVKIESFSDRSYATVTGAELGDERTATARVSATHTLPRNATLALATTLADVRYIETLSPSPGAQYRQVLSSSGAEIDLPLSSRTRLAAGAVLDRSDTPETGGREPGQPALADLGWRAGLVYDAHAAWQWHSSVSRRSRFPALRELYSGSLNRFRPNPELRPESLLGLETGVTYTSTIGPRSNASVQMTAFHHRLDDAVVRITLTNPTRFMRVNRDRIHSAGVEFVSGITWGDGGDRSASLTTDATIQRITVIDQSAGNAMRHAENNPERRGAATLGVPIALRLHGSISARYTGAQYCLHAESGQEVTLPAQTVGDVSLERTFAFVRRGPFRSLRALLALDNAMNAAVYDQCGLPQPGRTARAMITLR